MAQAIASIRHGIARAVGVAYDPGGQDKWLFPSGARSFAPSVCQGLGTIVPRASQ